MDDGIQDLDELARFLDLNQDSPENMIIETSTPHDVQGWSTSGGPNCGRVREGIGGSHAVYLQ